MDIQTETFSGQYPFSARYIQIAGHRMHYVDERPGGQEPSETVVMLHGNPTWSFLYRKFVAPLVEAGCRCVVPDQIGYGRSDSPTDRSIYNLATKIDYFGEFMEAMDLRDVTLVMQDWGGPIGMGWATQHADRIKRIVLMSTWAFVFPGVGEEELPPLFQFCRQPGIGEAMLLGYNFFVEAFFQGELRRRENVSEEIMDAYRAPFPDYDSRIPTLAIQDVPISESHPSFGTMQSIQERLGNLNVPTQIIWGEEDGVFPEMISDFWQAFYPHSELHTVPRAGHYIQEDAPQEVVALIRDFLGRTP